MMRYHSFYIKSFIALAIIMFTNQVFPQQLIQTFTQVNISGDTYFGVSVSNAGDVNGDGYSDVIVGGSYYNSNTGRAFIYYGGNSMADTPAVTLTGKNLGDNFGWSVSSAGDVNNDGYGDVIVGAYGYNSSTGRAYIYYGGSPMDNVADVILTGEGTGNYFGVSVSSAGDVNNDGYADVIVGADGYNSLTGRAYIYFGGSSMNNIPDDTLTGEAANSYFGYSVSSAGDVNNDGYADVIVGAYGYNSSTGRAYIYLGGSSMGNVPYLSLNGEATNNYFGVSVSKAGDVNNDGFSDIIVGADGYNSGIGRAYIYYGGSSMDGTPDVVFTGKSPVNYFGASVSDAGDVNNDGYSDVIVGVDSYNPGSGNGYAYIYYGGSSMDTTADVTLSGEETNSAFGYSVSSAGDVNNDGYSDIIVGAANFNSGTGRAYIYYGGSSMDTTSDKVLNGEFDADFFGLSVSGAGDVNGDGFSDIIVGAFGYNFLTGRAYIYYGGNSMNGMPDVTLTGEGPFNYFGHSVSSAGDVNKDGYADVIVGAPYYNNYTGRAYIYYGGANMDDTADVILNGESTYSYFGWSVSGAGDVNKDGYADVIVGAFNYDYALGQAFIYYGGSNMDNTPDVTLNGEGTYSYFGYSVSGAGDVNNDGYSDVIVGAYGYNSAYIYYGSSNMDDTADVLLTGSGSFGNSVSGAGDVNNDGYADVIVGATNYNSNTGAAYIYYGDTSMVNTPAVILSGENAGDFFGISVSGAGDVNDDGYADVIVGASGYNSGQGRAYVFYGDSTMADTADVKITGEETGDYFAYSVSGAGDINGDGYADFLVGDPNYNSNNGKVYLYSDNSAPLSVRNTINGNGQPSRFSLEQNYPNPFNPTTKIDYKIAKPGLVSLKIYDALGREVATLVNGFKNPGSYTIQWNADRFASGIYFYRITVIPNGRQAGKFIQVKKMILLK